MDVTVYDYFGWGTKVACRKLGEACGLAIVEHPTKGRVTLGTVWLVPFGERPVEMQRAQKRAFERGRVRRRVRSFVSG